MENRMERPSYIMTSNHRVAGTVQSIQVELPIYYDSRTLIFTIEAVSASPVLLVYISCLVS